MLDLPSLFEDVPDKKRILRLLIKDIAVIRVNGSKEASLNVRWQGGSIETISITMPAKSYDRWRHSESTINEVRLLAKELTDKQIALDLNKRGIPTVFGTDRNGVF